MEEFDILKKKVGKNYQFFYLDGKKVTNKKILDYVKTLYFPPAYKNIKISSNAHLNHQFDFLAFHAIQ